MGVGLGQMKMEEGKEALALKSHSHDVWGLVHLGV